MRRAPRRVAGVVSIEFLIAFAPLLLLFLASAQLALLTVAEAIARSAAVAGVRAAVVLLDDDPRFYDGAERNAIEENPDGPRMAAIRDAVHARIAAIAAAPSAHDAGSLDAALGTARRGAHAAGVTTAVTFPTAPHAATRFEARVDARELLTLRVTHLWPCLVPVAAALLCTRLTWDAERSRWSAPTAHAAAAGAALHELARAPFAGEQGRLATRGAYFRILRVEASLPSQRAAYRYESERHAGHAR